jgi:GntR family transcriptional repressor for pyruvate dehydrogenase complex
VDEPLIHCVREVVGVPYQQRITRDSLVDQVVERVRTQILTGELPPGSLLPPERDFAARLGVTRTSLKHALVRLAEARLVETRHGIGTRVADYQRSAGLDLLPTLLALHGADWLPEIFEARREVGALLAARAAERVTAPRWAELRALLDLVRGAADTDEVQLAECEVHRTIAEMGDNRVYGLLANGLLGAYLEVRQLFREPFADPAVAADRLAPMVEAIAGGDPQGAAAAADAYLALTQRLMLGEPVPEDGS